MTFWVLTLAYWFHLLATAIWFGGLIALALLAWSAQGHQTVVENQWLAWQARLIPWINLSLIVLLITGFVQMTNDTHYSGFLVLDSLWSWGLLFKHLVFTCLLGLMIYWQAVVHPEIKRLIALAEQKPQLALREGALAQRREKQLLRLNIVCGVVILFLTALMTAVP